MRPEKRIAGQKTASRIFFAAELKTHPENATQTLGTHQENYGWSYDFASGCADAANSSAPATDYIVPLETIDLSGSNSTSTSTVFVALSYTSKGEEGTFSEPQSAASSQFDSNTTSLPVGDGPSAYGPHMPGPDSLPRGSGGGGLYVGPGSFYSRSGATNHGPPNSTTRGGQIAPNSGAGAAAWNGAYQYLTRFNQNLLNFGQNVVNFAGATAGYLTNLADRGTRGNTLAATGQEFKALVSAQAWQQYGNYLISSEGLADTAFNIDLTLAGGFGTNCFPAGTKVSTPHGDENIEDLKVGDLVYAYDFAAGAVVESHVIETPRHFTYNWMSITVDGETIRATRGHRFWVESEKSWVEAVDLKEGMTVRLSDNRITAITAVSLASLEKSEPTFNLEIENQHTYFVGQHHVLVHNPYPLGPQYPPATQVGQNFQFNFDTSPGFQNSRSAGVARALAAGIINPGEIGHHINSVQNYPWLAAEPSNIQGTATIADHLSLHGGNWRNPTSGPLVPCY